MPVLSEDRGETSRVVDALAKNLSPTRRTRTHELRILVLPIGSDCNVVALFNQGGFCGLFKLHRKSSPSAAFSFHLPGCLRRYDLLPLVSARDGEAQDGDGEAWTGCSMICRSSATRGRHGASHPSRSLKSKCRRRSDARMDVIQLSSGNICSVDVFFHYPGCHCNSMPSIVWICILGNPIQASRKDP